MLLFMSINRIDIFTFIMISFIIKIKTLTEHHFIIMIITHHSLYSTCISNRYIILLAQIHVYRQKVNICIILAHWACHSYSHSNIDGRIGYGDTTE